MRFAAGVMRASRSPSSCSSPVQMPPWIIALHCFFEASAGIVVALALAAVWWSINLNLKTKRRVNLPCSGGRVARNLRILQPTLRKRSRAAAAATRNWLAHADNAQVVGSA